MSEDKRLFDFSTWEFVKNIRKSNVVNLTWFAPFGLIMYGLTSLFYILMATSFTEDRFHDLSWSIFSIHVFVGLLVLLDSVRFCGSSVLLQTFIIGLGIFNTFAVSSLLGGVLARNMDDDTAAYTLCSLLSACLSNSMMVALLFAMFHSTFNKVYAVQNS